MLPAQAELSERMDERTGYLKSLVAACRESGVGSRVPLEIMVMIPYQDGALKIWLFGI